ncbi:VOC family protein [Streptomyces cellulosae]
MTLQLTIDCSDPQRMVAFWAPALGYVPEPAPEGHPTWRAYWEAMGVPAEELPPGAGDLAESIVDPTGRGPRVWFQQVPESKTLKNRWHFDLKVGGGRDVPPALRREAGRRRRGAAGRCRRHRPQDQGRAGRGVLRAAALQDPEGNEFDVA